MISWWVSALLGLGSLAAGLVVGLVIVRLMNGDRRLQVAMEPYTTGTGQRLLVHTRATCEGWCPIHAPTVHHMATWPTAWNSDRRFMERVCEHEVHHPDPDDTLVRAMPSAVHHKCDGCCWKKDIT